MLSKGAMFGLDARIALAIFGALSVISGAALYSAIQKAKITQVIVTHQEVSKAVEQYLLDVGLDLPVHSTALTNVKAYELVENNESANGWKGPYWSSGVALYELKDISVGKYLHSFIKKAKSDSTWFLPTNADACDGSGDCYYWVETNCYQDAVVKALDLEIDGVDGASVGDFRYAACSTASDGYKVYHKTIRTLNQ